MAKQRKTRARRKWLSPSDELNAMAQRRTVMVLSVLSGEKTVGEAVKEGQISRGHYYLLEKRALRAMLEALAPMGTQGRPPEASQQIHALQKRVQQLSVEKRRAERLLEATRRLIPRGSIRAGPGRPRRRSTASGKSASPPPQKEEAVAAEKANSTVSTRSGGAENSPARPR